jgi:hypothetical protein
MPTHADTERLVPTQGHANCFTHPAATPTTRRVARRLRTSVRTLWTLMGATGGSEVGTLSRCFRDTELRNPIANEVLLAFG